MNQVVVQSTARDDFKLRLTIFAAVALLLGGDRHLRTDGVLRAQRTQKIGIRIARGASPRDMRNMVVSPGHATGVDRCGLGLAGAFGLTRLMASLLFGVKASDPVVFGLVAVLSQRGGFRDHLLARPPRHACRSNGGLALRVRHRPASAVTGQNLRCRSRALRNVAATILSRP